MSEIQKIIAITDDDALIRNSLEKTILKNVAGTTIKQFATTVELKKFLYNNPNALDLLILDIHFGIGETGIDILPDIKKFAPSLPVILLSSMEKTYGEAVTSVAGEYITDFISKPVTATELIIKIKKTLAGSQDISKKVRDLELQNAVLTDMVDSEEKGAGRLFEDEVCKKIAGFSKIFMGAPNEPKLNKIINGQEIDILAFTAPPLPFCVFLFETKYFPNSKLYGSANEPLKVVSDGVERVNAKRKNLFEQSENQFKQTSKRIEKILADSGFKSKDEIYRPFIQSFIVFPDTTDITSVSTSNANRYTKLCRLKDLTADFFIKTAFALPKRNIVPNVKNIILTKLFE
ncbi:MAG: response regulator [Elusimicrobia bacterium]|nr:response regulator [Elusimicrobiota bacterium]